MVKLSAETQGLIAKLRQNRQQLTMSVATWKNGMQQVCTFGPDGSVMEGVSPRYEVGSITKTFTAGLLAKQVYEGRLALEDGLDSHIEGLPQGYYPSLRRLAVHASGYPSSLPIGFGQTLRLLATMNKPGQGLVHKNPYHGRVDEAEMKALLAANRVKDKEYGFAYNNFAFGVLGYIVGKAEGTNCWQALNAYAQAELGLSGTRLGTADTIGGYDSKNRPAGNWQWGEDDLVAAAGGLTAPVEDVLRYAVLNLNEERPWLALSHQKHGQGNKKWEMGLGWRIDREAPIVWHDGNAGAFSAFVGFNKQAGTAVAVLTNYGLIGMQDIGFSALRGL